MSIKKYKPISSARRNMTILYRKKNKFKPLKKLRFFLKKKGGRNNSGKITVRHRGGGHKRLYRIIDFKRSLLDIKAKVKSIEYDPNRNVDIALLIYKNGIKKYILAPKGIKIGDIICNGKKSSIKIGNSKLLKYIPEGSLIHNIELKPKKGAQLVRSAGTYAKILGFEDKYAIIQLPSKEIRKILSTCTATIGKLGNEDYNLIKIGKAGKKRWLGIRPTVRGSAMNPVDHPHGGGEGKAPIGNKSPMSPWGKKTLGLKTRKKKRISNKLIIKNRKQKK